MSAETEPQVPANLRIAKLVIEAGRAVVWPLLIACLVAVYHRPLRAVMDSFASKFSEASKVSIGSLSVEVQERAREAGNPALAQQVGALSPSAVEELLRTPRSGEMYLVSAWSNNGKREYGVPKSDI